MSRFQEVLKEDPAYTRRDEVYFYLGELFLRADNKAEALPYFERLTKEFVESEYLARANQRIQELKAQ